MLCAVPDLPSLVRTLTHKHTHSVHTLPSPPTCCRSTVVCCSKDQTDKHPETASNPSSKSSNAYEMTSEPMARIQSVPTYTGPVAGTCQLNITYFNVSDLSHDGLCVGTVVADWCVRPQQRNFPGGADTIRV